MSSEGNKILDNIRYATARLSVFNNAGEERIGTGFFFVVKLDEEKSFPLLITNKHMICDNVGAEDWTTLSFKMNKADDNGDPIYGNPVSITMKNVPKQLCIIHPDVDLCAFHVWGHIEKVEKQGTKLCFKYFPENLIPNEGDMPYISSIEDILMVGYPDGMADDFHNLPIVRRGITATDFKIDYNGKKEFLIDVSIFKGSSGSPIVICNIGSYNDEKGKLCLGNKVMFLGIQYRGEFSKYQNNIFIKTTEGKTVNATNVLSAYFNDLGYCVKSECLLYFKEIIMKRYCV